MQVIIKIKPSWSIKTVCHLFVFKLKFDSTLIIILGHYSYNTTQPENITSVDTLTKHWTVNIKHNSELHRNEWVIQWQYTCSEHVLTWTMHVITVFCSLGHENMLSVHCVGKRLHTWVNFITVKFVGNIRHIFKQGNNSKLTITNVKIKGKKVFEICFWVYTKLFYF